jgi:hypothetical protein
MKGVCVKLFLSMRLIGMSRFLNIIIIFHIVATG